MTDNDISISIAHTKYVIYVDYIILISENV